MHNFTDHDPSNSTKYVTKTKSNKEKIIINKKLSE